VQVSQKIAGHLAELLALVLEGKMLLDILTKKRSLEKFRQKYEIWYTKSQSVVKIILPDRLDDFKRYYSSKEKTHDTLLKAINYTKGMFEELSMPNQVAIAVPLFENQLNILKACSTRFSSRLYDIEKVLQADLFDSELDAASELLTKGFTRAAGAIAGVVLEKHLAEVCKEYKITVSRKHPTISDFNESLKSNGIIEIKDWRRIQHLADLRNLCDHNKSKEPSKDDIDDLINGVKALQKTLGYSPPNP
jgi:hypothetical protein